MKLSYNWQQSMGPAAVACIHLGQLGWQHRAWQPGSGEESDFEKPQDEGIGLPGQGTYQEETPTAQGPDLSLRVNRQDSQQGLCA